MYWLSHGGGVNSMALTVLLCEGALPEFTPWEAIFSDTGDEKDETYAYIDGVLKPYLKRHDKELVTVHPKETVLERWERNGVTGSRILRSCTDHAKVQPITRYVAERGCAAQLIGIDADEQRRVRPDRPGELPRRYPLIEAGIGRRGCVAIIQAAGLCVPAKSGCWHCPFNRKREVIELAIKAPERVQRIAELEAASALLHPREAGKQIYQWGDRPAEEWLALARAEQEQGRIQFTDESPEDMPCGCYDG